MNRLGFVVFAVLVGCGDGKSPSSPDAGGDAGSTQSLVERGRYISNVLGACTFCHTPLLENGTRDLDNLFAGVDCFIDITSPDLRDDGDGEGCLSTRNLTNHPTGLANATDQQIKDALKNGIRTDGKKLVPLMPFWVFHNMSDEDLDAVVAYLRTVPGIDHAVKANEPPFSQYNNGEITAIPPLFDEEIKPLALADIPLPRGGANNASAMRGRYLSSMAGLCIDCHSGTKSPLSLEVDKSKIYGGGRVFPRQDLGLLDPAFPPAIAVRNITPHATGLGGWTREQIRAAIADGKDRDGNQVCAATHGGLISGYAALEPQDLEDITEYIYNLPEVDNDAGLASCGPPPIGAPEDDADCGNGMDDDGDTVPDDGCYVPCGDCAGPPVP